MDKKRLGDNIKTRRDALGLTQEVLSSDANIANRALQRIEAGEDNSNPTIETLDAIAGRLGREVIDLLEDGNGSKRVARSAAAEHFLAALDFHPLQRYLALFFLTNKEFYLREYWAYVKEHPVEAESFDLTSALQAIQKLAT
jgi:transcriptional regulator with XRE-family HTH domain